VEKSLQLVDKCGKIVGSFIRNSQKGAIMPKRTHQPKVARRHKVHGFRARMATKGGQDVIRRRRAKGRYALGSA